MFRYFKLIIISVGLFCLIQNSQGQILDEAILLSQQEKGGSARIQSLGGAGVSLGGDLSMSSINPAGLAFFKRSRISGTLALNVTDFTTTLNGEKNANQFSSNFGFDQLGALWHLGTGQKGIRNAVLSLNYNKQRVYKQDYEYGNSSFFRNRLIDQGEMIPNLSIVDYFRTLAFGVSENDLQGDNKLEFFDAAAYDQYLIDPLFNDTGQQFSDYGTAINGDPLQRETIQRTGSIGQWDFSYAANFENKLFFGASLSVPSFNITTNRFFRESDYLLQSTNTDGSFSYNQDTEFDRIEFNRFTTIDGNAINGSLGIILVPNKFFRIGLNYRTPTVYIINRRTSFELNSFNTGRTIVDNGETITLGNNSLVSSEFESNYRLRSPSILSVGATILGGKNGFLTFEAERTRLSNLNVSSLDFDVQESNTLLGETYQDIWNLKMGGEIRWESFMLRAGYAIFGDPHLAESVDLSYTNTTLGVGFKSNTWSFDLAVILSQYKDNIAGYVPPVNDFSQDLNGDGNTDDPLGFPVADIDASQFKTVFTLGYSF